MKNFEKSSFEEFVETDKNIQAEITRLNKKSVDSLNRSIQTLQETREISHESMVALDQQGEQIARMTGRMNYISVLQDQADKYLRTIGSIFGSTVNLISDANPISVNSIKNYLIPKKDLEDRERLNLPAVQAVQTQVIQIEEPKEIDLGLDLISAMLSELHKEAILIGEELDRHNCMLTDLSSHVDLTSERMYHQTLTTRRLT